MTTKPKKPKKVYSTRDTDLDLVSPSKFSQSAYSTQSMPAPKSAAIDGSAVIAPEAKTSKLGAIKDLAPFASNMINALRKPPMPAKPGRLSPVTLGSGRVDYSNERAEADRLVRGADLGAERGLDGNTAASVRAGNLTQKFRMYSDSYSREASANGDLATKQALVNSGIEEKNVRATDYYNQQKVERQIAQQGQQSANVANASDKFTSMQNEKAKRELEGKNFAITSKVFENSGVLTRLMKKLKAEGIDDPSNTKRFGGKLKRAFK